jgi:hypothetical protein
MCGEEEMSGGDGALGHQAEPHCRLERQDSTSANGTRVRLDQHIAYARVYEDEPIARVDHAHDGRRRRRLSETFCMHELGVHVR